MRRIGLELLATVVLAAAVTGCGSGSVLVTDASRCLPEPLSVEPPQVVPGSSVTLSSPAFRCHASYPAGKHYALSLVPYGGGPVDLGTVPVRRDGSFRATVAVPATTPAGEADLSVRGSPYDQPCEDGESCAGYSTLLTLLPPG